MNSFTLRHHRKSAESTEPSDASAMIASQPPQVMPYIKNDHMAVRPEEEIHRLGFFKEQRAALQRGVFEHTSEHEGRSILPYTIAAIMLIGSLVAGWFVYLWLTQPVLGLPPIISADVHTYRVRPESPGGLVIPHQDKLIYNQLSGQTPALKERLLPPPEELIMPAYEQQEISELTEDSEFYEAYLPGTDSFLPTHPIPEEMGTLLPSPPTERGRVIVVPEQQQQHSGVDASPPVAALKQHMLPPRLQTVIPSSQTQPMPGKALSQEKPVPVLASQPMAMAAPLFQSEAPLLIEEFDHQALDALIDDPATFDLSVDSSLEIVPSILSEERAVESRQNVPIEADSHQTYMLQIGAFATQSQAQREIDRLREMQKSVPNKRLMLKPHINASGQTEYRVFIGTLYHLDEAVQLKAFMKQHYQISEGIIIKSKQNG